MEGFITASPLIHQKDAVIGICAQHCPCHRTKFLEQYRHLLHKDVNSSDTDVQVYLNKLAVKHIYSEICRLTLRSLQNPRLQTTQASFEQLRGSSCILQAGGLDTVVLLLFYQL